MKSRISIIVAVDEKNGIAKNGDLLFRIPEDLKRLRAITDGHPLVMGRKTFAPFPKLLPNRTHIVITRDPQSLAGHNPQPHYIVTSLEEGLEIAEKVEQTRLRQGSGEASEIFIFGGGQIFKEALEKDLVDRIYITLVKGDYGADTFFSDYSNFTKVVEKIDREADGFQYTFLTLEK